MFSHPRADVGGGLLLVHAPANDFANHLTQRCPVLHPERIGFTQRLLHGDVASSRPLIGLDKHAAKQSDVVEFVHADHAFSVNIPRNILEGQRREVFLDQRNLHGDSRHKLVDIVERPSIGKLHHYEEGLLKWIDDHRGSSKDSIEALLDKL